MSDQLTDALLAARARVVRDLAAYGLDTAPAVSVLDAVVASRRWWVEQWPEGAAYIACLVAQDVQEQLAETLGRWPMCCVPHSPDADVAPHELRVSPDLGADPQWVCEEDGVVVAAVGALARG